MSANTPVVADLNTESHPDYYQGNPEDLYIKGYDPMSLAASHSSLLKTSTWLGMGFILAMLAGIGTFIYGAGQLDYGSGLAGHDPMTFVWLGLGITVVLAVGGVFAIRAGRKEYHEYVKRSGRSN